MNQLLLQYSYLQVLDFLTTIAFLLHGVQEGNPVVRLALRFSPHPLSGLLVIKFAAVTPALAQIVGPSGILFLNQSTIAEEVYF